MKFSVNPEQVTHVIYHDNCMDGYGAAWTAHRFNPSIKCSAANYGNPPPRLSENAVVAILDFSYSKPVLEELRSRVKAAVVIDHHKSNAEDLAGVPDTHFDFDHSGAILAWEWFFASSPPPILQFIEDRDLWRFELPYSREINAYLQSLPKTAEAWDRAAELPIDYVIPLGTACLEFKQRGVEAILRNMQYVDLAGLIVPVFNTCLYFSEACDDYLQTGRHLFCGYYFDLPSNRRQWGLRARGNFDCIALARRFGGGGHPDAAGFTTGRSWPPKPIS